MKIKIFNEFEYQLHPIIDEMIEVDFSMDDLLRIGFDKKFDVETNTIIDYVSPDIYKAEIKARLSALTEDIIQSQAGEIVPNIAEKKAEFIALHNELRELEGKAPRDTEV